MNETLAPGQVPSLSSERLRDQVADRFEDAWKESRSGADPPQLIDFLGAVSAADRDALLLELLPLDDYYRRQRGAVPQQQDCNRRVPSLARDELEATSTLPRHGQIEKARHGKPAVVADAGSDELHSTIRNFGDYELLAEIARGGMGIVYKARQRSLQRIVAVKTILTGHSASEADILRFQAEAEAAAQLDHPGIVPIYEVGELAGQHYFSMGYVDGESLAVQIAHGPLLPRRAAELLRQVALAVQYAHEQGVIHRDLKPSNILLDELERPRVTDFGLAKRVESDSNLTVSGQVVGTPSYIPPEQAAGQLDKIGPASDIYGLGAVLYAMLTGGPPFRAATVAETLRQVSEQDPVPLHQINPAIPRDLETIALKCLEKDPVRRYATAAVVAEDLERWLTSKPILARPASRWERAVKWGRRRPAMVASVAMIFAVTLLAFVLVTSSLLAEKKARGETQQLVVRLSLNQGRSLCEQGDVNRGLLWLAYTLQHAPRHDTDTQWVIRANLAEWQRQLIPLRCMLPHSSPVQAARFSPKGKFLLTVGEDNAIRLWSSQGEPIGSPLSHGGPVRAAVFSPDEQQVLTACEDGLSRRWDARTGEQVFPTLQHTGPVLAAVFSPDGKQILTGSEDGMANLWETSNGKPLGQPLRHVGPVNAVAFSPDGSQILTGCEDGTARLWLVDSLETAPIELSTPENGVWAVQFSPDGETLLTAAENRHEGTSVVQLWDAATGQPRATLQRRWEFRAVVFSPDGKTVLTGNADYTAQLWDTATGAPILDPPLQHQDSVTAVAFSPDGKLLLTGSSDRMAHLWRKDTGAPVGLPLEHPAPVESVAFSPDGLSFVTVSGEPAVRLWDTRVSPPALRTFPQDNEVMTVAVSPDRRAVAIGTKQGEAHVLDADTGEERARFTGHTDEIWASVYTPSGAELVTASRDATVRLWNVADTQAAPQVLLHDYRVRTIAVSPDSKLLLTGGGGMSDGLACLWTLPPGDKPLTLLREGTVWSVAFSPQLDESICAIASGQNTIHLWKNVHAGKLSDAVVLEPLHSTRVVALAFSSDGKWLLSGSIDRTVRVWSVDTGSPVSKPLQHASAVWAVAFSPDGRLVIVGCRDGTVRVWDKETGTPIGPYRHHDHEGTVWNLGCDPRDATVWSVSDDKTVRQWQLPCAMEGDPERITQWAQVITGMTFDQHHTAHCLDATTWQRIRQELRQSGAPRLR